MDIALLAICALGLALGCYGLWWGWVECWNPDQMALLPLRRHLYGFLPEPLSHFKPPFFTYMNYALVVLPFQAIAKVVRFASGEYVNSQVPILYGARLLQQLLFLGSAYISYRIVERALNRDAGRMVALFVATSAGIVLQAHFLTADIPVTFWMLTSFFAAQFLATTGRLRYYIAAGLLTGVATATKYNGLAVGLAIPLFHWLANLDRPFLSTAFDKRLIAGVAAVVPGFILADPFAVLSWKEFAADFSYNYTTTPVYDGRGQGNSFLLFPVRIVEIVGLPLAVIIAGGVVATLVLLRRWDRLQRATFAAAAGVSLLYFYKFGSMPRLEARFVLPIVPFLFIAAAPALIEAYNRYRAVTSTVLIAVISYNVLASAWVGHRFANDPRMEAQTWVAQNVPPGTALESSYYTPKWNKYPGIEVNDVRMPDFFAKRARLTQAFSDNSKMSTIVQERESDNGSDWFEAHRLASRKPEYIALNSLYYSRFLTSPNTEAYPEIASYFQRLLRGELGYGIVLDRSASASPTWLYPRDIGFVDNRIILLKRADAAPGKSS